MNPITMIYKLKLKGYNLADIARKNNTSRQLVRASIYTNPQRGKIKKIRQEIDKILNS